MAIPQSDDVRAFSYWLRTGRWLARRSPATIEVKFNPWHDPANGEFTFANSGDYHARRGGGGDFGGGGSSGSYDAPRSPRAAAKPSLVKKQQVSKAKAPDRTSIVPVGLAVRPPVETFRRVTKNGYEFELDSGEQMRRASGTLTMGTEKRNLRGQRVAGGSDRRSTDDGGHYIARRFNGPPDDFNLFPQDANFNRGTYRLLEEQWARAKRAGKKVEIEIVPGFEAGSTRPYEVDVTFWINGRRESIKFPNEKSEKRRGK